MKLLILASGQGKRLKNKTYTKPKCLVKVKDKSIIEYLIEHFHLFKKVIIVGGHKYSKLKKYNSSKCRVFYNKDYSKTNMVHSLFSVKKFIKSDIIISYSDIIYSEKVLLKMIKFKKTHIPINKNWLKVWKKRMSLKKIPSDAEDLKVSNGLIKMIGNKINKDMPKYQFMGLIRLNFKDYKKLSIYYFKIKNFNIDMTSFLNSAIEKKIIKLEYSISNDFWFEVDTLSDLKVANKIF
tara:strand:- start:83 stop:793 length:711 start_codon:yes stop_codon:yes gene_type:complete